MPQTRNRLKPVQTGRFHLGLVFSPWRRGAFGNLGPPPSRRSHWSRAMPPRKRPPRSLAGGPVDPLRASEGRRERAAAGGGELGGTTEGIRPLTSSVLRAGGGAGRCRLTGRVELSLKGGPAFSSQSARAGAAALWLAGRLGVTRVSERGVSGC